MTDHIAPLAQPSPRLIRLVITLALAGLFSGLLIVGVYEITLAPITANREASLRRAVLEVIPGSTRMQPLVWGGTTLDPVVKPEAGALVIYAGYDDAGVFQGYGIPAHGPGFQDDIALIFGYAPAERKIVGLVILESRETPGLGDKIYKDEAWVTAFRSLAVDPEVVVVKDGAQTANQIDAITGATISSNAVVKIVNAANGEWLERMPEPGAEPPLMNTTSEAEAVPEGDE